MDLLLHIGAGILGLATFLLAWGWLPLCVMWLPDHLMYRWHVPGDRAIKMAQIAGIGGCIALWIIYSYLLPDWWVAATPVIVSD